MLMVLTDWLTGLNDTDAALLLGQWQAELGYLRALTAPPGEPDPGPALKSSAALLAEFAAAWEQEAPLYRGWLRKANCTYQMNYVIRSLGAAWLAKPDDLTWLDEALDMALTTARYMATIPTLDRRALYEQITLRPTAWLLYEIEMRRDALTQAQLDKAAQLLEAVLVLVDYWHVKGWQMALTPGAWHIVVLYGHLSKLDPSPARQQWYAETIARLKGLIEAQYAKYPGGWKHMFNDTRTLVDVSHAQHEAEGVALMHRLGMPVADLTTMRTAFWRCYHADRGLFTFLIDGSDEGCPTTNSAHITTREAPFNWKHLILMGWGALGYYDAHIQAALEGYMDAGGDHYRAFMLGVLAENAAKWEQTSTI